MANGRTTARIPSCSTCSTSRARASVISLRACRDGLGFTVEGQTSFTADAPTAALTGLKGAQVRRSRVQAPGSTLWIELVEFKGVDRTPLRMKIQDRGAARLQVRVQDAEA